MGRVLFGLAAILFVYGGAQAGPADLLSGYQQVRAHLDDNTFGVPIHVRARSRDDQRAATVYGLLEHPYAAVREALIEPSDWCGFLPLNQNVKACTWQRLGDTAAVSLYVGRKHYQPPQDAMRVDGALAVQASRSDYTRVVLHAPEGPFGTADYRIVLEAAPHARGTLVRLRWSYRSSWRSRLATDAYLATLGRGKVGFTITGRDQKGDPRFIGGVEGVIERNAMRYYLALEAFLASAGSPSSERVRAAQEIWYAYTERYARQLRELSRADYLHTKQREYRDQVRLQRRAQGGGSPLAQMQSPAP